MSVLKLTVSLILVKIISLMFLNKTVLSLFNTVTLLKSKLCPLCYACKVNASFMV